MQDHQEELKTKPAAALAVLALADRAELPRTAAICEHSIAVSFRDKPVDEEDWDTISLAACRRILRAVAQQRDAAKSQPRSHTQPFPSLATADTMQTWR